MLIEKVEKIELTENDENNNEIIDDSDGILEEIPINNDWETLKNHEDYLINVNYPHQIKKKSNGKIIKERERNDGYIQCKLNQKQYLKHRIVAEQFIPNPDNLLYIDHINHVRTDNHIENLRWISKSENDKNRIKSCVNTNIEYEYFDKIDDDAIEVNNYGVHEFEFYYYVEKEDSFYFYNGHQYRKLHVNIKKSSGILFVCMMDKNNKRVFICINKFKKLYGIEF